MRHDRPETLGDRVCNRVLVNWALKVLRRIYRAGYAYQKAGVMLSELRPKAMAQASLLVDPENDRGQRLRVWRSRGR